MPRELHQKKMLISEKYRMHSNLFHDPFVRTMIKNHGQMIEWDNIDLDNQECSTFELFESLR